MKSLIKTKFMKLKITEKEARKLSWADQVEAYVQKRIKGCEWVNLNFLCNERNYVDFRNIKHCELNWKRIEDRDNIVEVILLDKKIEKKFIYTMSMDCIELSHTELNGIKAYN